MKMDLIAAAMAVALAASLSGCASAPTPNAELEAARSAYQAASADRKVARAAPNELRQAGNTLQRAEEAWKENRDPAEVTHFAYMSRQRTAYASSISDRHALEGEIKQAAARRDQVWMAARTREAKPAQEQAGTAQRQQELQGMQAKTGARGTVVTVGAVAFDTGKAQLQEGGRRSIGRLASTLKEDPERKVLVEGFTDSSGSRGTNMTLSKRRANAVKEALVAEGVAPDRVVTHAFGEAYPVASNATPSGRQMNRRVEVVISDSNGNLPSR